MLGPFATGVSGTPPHNGFLDYSGPHGRMTELEPRMFFDAGCGPCTFWARLTAGVSRTKLEIYSLDSVEADAALQSMAPDRRFAFFHIVESGLTWTGPDAMPAWAGLVGGKGARALAERAPPVNQLLRRAYHRFWEYRRTRGCAAEGWAAHDPAEPASR
jgi:predicted DCC family thiol-disulfide oxidoreductase YuxK